MEQGMEFLEISESPRYSVSPDLAKFGAPAWLLIFLWD